MDALADSSSNRSGSRYWLAAQSAFAGVFAHGVTVCTNFLLVPIMLHHLGAYQYGIWLTLQALTAFGTFLDFGISNSALNAIAVANAKRQYDRVSHVVSTALFALSGIGLLTVLAAWSFWDRLPWTLLFPGLAPEALRDVNNGAVIFMIYTAFLLPLAFVDRVAVAFQDGRVANISRSFAAVVTLAASIGVAWSGGSFSAMCLATTIPALITWALTWIYIGLRRPWIFSAPMKFSKNLLIELGSTGLLFLGVQATAVLAFALDNPLIAAIKGPAAVAAFAAHYKLFSLISVLSSLFLTPLWPAYADAAAHGEPAWIRRTLNWSVIAAALLAATVAIPLFIAFPTIMRIWLRGEITPNWPLAAGLAAQAIFASVGAAYAMFWNGTHQLRLQFALGVLYLCVSLPLRAWVLRTIGLDYYAAAVAASYLGCVVVPAYVIARRFAPPAAASGATADDLPSVAASTPIDQWLADAWCVNRGDGLYGRLSTTLLSRLRRLRLGMSDPPVTLPWSGRSLCAPLSHELGRYAAFFPEYNINLGRLANAVARVNSRPLFAVDVGANIGDTCILLADAGFSAILCVEASPHFFQYLTANTRQLTGVINVMELVDYDGAPSHLTLRESAGTAHAVPANGQQGIRARTLEDIVADHGLNRTVHLLKIDTDGYDGRILLQNEQFIRLHQPIIFVEIDLSLEDHSGLGECSFAEKALRMLQGLGYRNCVVFRNTGEAAFTYDVGRDIALFMDHLRSHTFGPYADIALFPVGREPEWAACMTEFALTPTGEGRWSHVPTPSANGGPVSRTRRRVASPEQGAG